jgi:hypothetical protein
VRSPGAPARPLATRSVGLLAIGAVTAIVWSVSPPAATTSTLVSISSVTWEETWNTSLPASLNHGLALPSVQTGSCNFSSLTFQEGAVVCLTLRYSSFGVSAGQDYRIQIVSVTADLPFRLIMFEGGSSLECDDCASEGVQLQAPTVAGNFPLEGTLTFSGSPLG